MRERVLVADAASMSTDWGDVLRRRLADDGDFREEFRCQPGRAVASLGVPYDRFRELWPEFAEAYDLTPRDAD